MGICPTYRVKRVYYWDIVPQKCENGWGWVFFRENYLVNLGLSALNHAEDSRYINNIGLKRIEAHFPIWDSLYADKKGGRKSHTV